MLWKNVNTNNNSISRNICWAKGWEYWYFLEKLSKFPSKAVVCHSYSEHCTSFVPNYKPPERAKFPNSLWYQYPKNNLNLNENELNLIVNEKFKNLKLPMTYFKKWHQLRVGRIIASRVHDVLHTHINFPSVSLIKSICKLSSVWETKVSSLKWGIDNERNAILRYAEFKTYQGHKDFQTTECGLYLYQKNSFLGASPYGIAKCSCHEDKRLIEVKCYYSK